MVESIIGEPQSEEHESNEELRAPLSEPEGGPTKTLRLNNDHDLSRVGVWSLSLGGLGGLIGVAFMLAGGILPGGLVVAVAFMCCLVGALSLALVAHHQG